METQKLLDEIDKLRNELILEQQKKSSLNNEDVQVKEKLYQETKSRANKAEQEVEAQKVSIFIERVLSQGPKDSLDEEKLTTFISELKLTLGNNCTIGGPSE